MCGSGDVGITEILLIELQHVAHQGSHGGCWCSLRIWLTDWQKSAGFMSSWWNAWLAASSHTETWGELQQRNVHLCNDSLSAFVTDWEPCKIEDLFVCFEALAPCASHTSMSSLLIELYSAFWLIPVSGGQGKHSSQLILLNHVSAPEYFFSQASINWFCRTFRDSWAACEELKTPSTQTTTHLSDFLCPCPSASLKACFASVSRALHSNYKPWRPTWDRHQHKETPKFRITYLHSSSLFFPMNRDRILTRSCLFTRHYHHLLRISIRSTYHSMVRNNIQVFKLLGLNVFLVPVGQRTKQFKSCNCTLPVIQFINFFSRLLLYSKHLTV